MNDGAKSPRWAGTPARRMRLQLSMSAMDRNRPIAAANYQSRQTSDRKLSVYPDTNVTDLLPRACEPLALANITRLIR